LRLPEAVRLLEAEGHHADDGRPREGPGGGFVRHPRGGRGRRLPPPRARPVGDDGEGRRRPRGHRLMFGFRRRIDRQRDGTYAIRLGDMERSLLAELPGQLATLVEVEPDDPWLQRLFPTAYPQDPEREQEWRLLMSVDLHDKRRAQLQSLAASAEATSLT